MSPPKSVAKTSSAAESEEEEDEEENGEEEETNGRAELRASSPTAGYQQRQTERPGYDRESYRDRGRRGGPRRGVRARPNNNRNQPLITDLLKEGQEVLIQIAKEPIGKKGARITSHIALPGRFLVYMPTVNHVGVSRKIASEEERQRLKRIVTSERENGLGGFIVRTAAANIKEDELRADIRFLKHLWAEIKNRAENSKSPALDLSRPEPGGARVARSGQRRLLADLGGHRRRIRARRALRQPLPALAGAAHQAVHERRRRCSSSSAFRRRSTAR